MVGTPIPLPQSSDRSETTIWSAQRMINAVAELPARGSQPATKVRVSRTSGYRAFVSNVGESIRGHVKFEGDLYVASDGDLYKITPHGLRYKVGTGIGDAGSVSMAANRTQVCVVVRNGDGYVFDTTNPTAGVVRITNPAYRPAKAVAVMDGFGVFIALNSNVFFLSGIEDFTVFDALDFAEAEKESDDLVAIVSDHSELWLMGERTIEPHFNTGATFPFARIPQGLIERGIAGPKAVTKEDNTIFWLGDDRQPYRADGYRPEAIADGGTSEDIAGLGVVTDCVVSAWTERGHKYIAYAFPTEGRMFVWDVVTQLWSERMRGVHPETPLSYCGCVTTLGSHNVMVEDGGSDIIIIDPAIYDDTNGVFDTLLTNAAAAGDTVVTLDNPAVGVDDWLFIRQTSGGQHFARVTATGATATFTPPLPFAAAAGAGVHVEKRQPLMFEITTPPIYAGARTVFAGALELVCRTGDGPGEPQIMMQFSGDGGKTWSNEHWRSLGAAGQGKRVRWTRQGKFRQRMYKFRVTDNVPVEIIDMTLEMEPGDG